MAAAWKRGHPSRGLVLRWTRRRGPPPWSGRWRVGERTPALSQGNLQVLDDGSSFVGWGEEPFFTGFDRPAGSHSKAASSTPPPPIVGFASRGPASRPTSPQWPRARGRWRNRCVRFLERSHRDRALGCPDGSDRRVAPPGLPVAGPDSRRRPSSRPVRPMSSSPRSTRPDDELGRSIPLPRLTPRQSALRCPPRSSGPR